MENQILNPLIRVKDHLIDHFPSLFWGLISFFIMLALGLLLKKVTQNRLKRRINDVLLVNFIGRVIVISFSILGLVFFLNAVGWGTAASSLLAGAGVTAIVLGFAFKDIGENFIAGFFLAFSRPFGIGDLIEVQGVKGTVRAMSFRTTHVRTFDGQDIYLPNAMLVKNPLSNYTKDGLLRHKFLLGIDYGDDAMRAMQLLSNKLKNIEGVEHSPGLKPFMLIEDFGTSTINLAIYFWTNESKGNKSIIDIKNEVMSSCLSTLATAGYTMPADIVELKIYQEEHPIPVALKNPE
jgi:small-conductance mechanosensitive channel